MLVDCIIFGFYIISSTIVFGIMLVTFLWIVKLICQTIKHFIF